MFCSRCGRQLDAATVFCSGCGAPVGGAAPAPTVPPYASPPPVQPPPYASAFPYASWGDRAIGYIIDSLFVFAVMILLGAVCGSFFFASAVGFGHGDPFSRAMCCFLIFLFPLSTLLVGLYNRVYLVSLRGYSIGQGVMKLKVVDAQGALLSQGTAFIRLIVHAALGIVPLLPLLDLLWPLWDPYRQTLHDKAVGCFVIYNSDVR